MRILASVIALAIALVWPTVGGTQSNKKSTARAAADTQQRFVQRPKAVANRSIGQRPCAGYAWWGCVGWDPDPAVRQMLVRDGNKMWASRRLISAGTGSKPCQFNACWTLRAWCALKEKKKKEKVMTKFALYVPLQAKPGKEKEVADFLRSAVPLVNAEVGTISWFAIQEGPSSFAIFDTFDDEAGRDAHLNGEVAAALMEKAKAGDLFAKAPDIHKIEILADKLPR
jgi:quinol monooxygenase YgiN